MTSDHRVYHLSWGLIALIALIVLGLIYAWQRATVVTFQLQPKSAPAAKPLSTSAPRQPESVKPSNASAHRSAIRGQRGNNFAVHHVAKLNQPAGPRAHSGAQVSSVSLGASQRPQAAGGLKIYGGRRA